MMVRSRWLVVGCILIAIGFGLCILGYNKMQPSGLDHAVGVLEAVSGEKAPSGLKTDKTEGYVLIAAGAVSFFVGVGLTLKRR